MTRKELAARFPNASKAFLDLAADDVPRSIAFKGVSEAFDNKQKPIALSFFVAGKPQGKGRPRFTRSGHCFTPAKTRKYEAQIKDAAIAALQASGIEFGAFAVGPLAICATAYFAYPKSWNDAKRKASAGWHTQRPDADNILKAICDALNDACIWHDDAQIASAKIRKIWGLVEGVRVEISNEVLP